MVIKYFYHELFCNEHILAWQSRNDTGGSFINSAINIVTHVYIIKKMGDTQTYNGANKPNRIKSLVTQFETQKGTRRHYV